MNEQRTEDTCLYEEAGVTWAEIGPNQWCVELPQVGPIIVTNRALSKKIFDAAVRSYHRGHGDAMKELRRLIGVE